MESKWVIKNRFSILLEKIYLFIVPLGEKNIDINKKMEIRESFPSGKLSNNLWLKLIIETTDEIKCLYV